jgi:hypothetical protein
MIILGGILVFILFYFIGTFFYPGGSNFNSNTIGYKWNYNYWCELLGEYAKNGEPNNARPFGFIGMLGLAFGVSSFWYFIPEKILEDDFTMRLTSVTGIVSMILSAFIFTNLHDIVIYGAVVSGSIAFILLFYGIYKSHKRILFFSGLFCLLLIMINCFIYLTNLGIDHLPSLQKFTFLATLLWISRISFIFSTLNKN